MRRTPFTATDFELRLLVAKAEKELDRRQAVKSSRGARYLNSLELRESLKSSHPQLTYKQLATIAPLEEPDPTHQLKLKGTYKAPTPLPRLKRVVRYPESNISG